jgi:hypothetical protein
MLCHAFMTHFLSFETYVKLRLRIDALWTNKNLTIQNSESVIFDHFPPHEEGQRIISN